MRLVRFVLLFVAVASAIAGGYIYQIWTSYDELFELRPPEHTDKKPEFTSIPDFATKAAIIRVMLSDVSESDHSVNDDGNIYLAVSEEVFSLLPRRINDIGLVRYLGPIGLKERDVSHIVFSRWGVRDEKVFVTRTSYFAGGNLGGCREEYENDESFGWQRVSSKCFAMVS